VPQSREEHAEKKEKDRKCFPQCISKIPLLIANLGSVRGIFNSQQVNHKKAKMNAHNLRCRHAQTCREKRIGRKQPCMLVKSEIG
jgi:hypothetical protein